MPKITEEPTEEISASEFRKIIKTPARFANRTAIGMGEVVRVSFAEKLGGICEYHTAIILSIEGAISLRDTLIANLKKYDLPAE